MFAQSTDVDISSFIYEILNRYRKNPFKITFDAKPIVKKLNYFVERGLPIQLVFPACHGKAASSDCVIDHLPDMGEYLGLNHFANMCEEITAIYSQGVQLNLVHEGHFYTQTPLVGDDIMMDAYLAQLRKMINQYSFMKSITIRNFFPALNTYKECREYFFATYVPCDNEIESIIKGNEKYQRLYQSYKKLYSKYILNHKRASVSHRQIQKEAGTHAKMQLRIYMGFGKLEKEYFGSTPYIRLSALYKKPSDADQIAIDYIANKHHMATPAFYCVLRQLNGEYTFIKKIEAMRQKYSLMDYEGFAYFQEKA